LIQQPIFNTNIAAPKVQRLLQNDKEFDEQDRMFRRSLD